MDFLENLIVSRCRHCGAASPIVEALGGFPENSCLQSRFQSHPMCESHLKLA